MSLEKHRKLLRERFLDELLERGPSCVLDVGCGNGSLIEACEQAGIPAFGVEPGLIPPAAGSTERVLRADARALPCLDRSVDWVCLRHVTHHLAHPGASWRDALRVARSGLLVAEPWFDETRSEHRFALRLDRLLKRQDRRRGMLHGDALTEDDLRALVPPGANASECARFAPEGLWSAQEVDEEAARASSGLRLESEDERELATLRELAERGALALPGTLLLTLRREPG